MKCSKYDFNLKSPAKISEFVKYDSVNNDVIKKAAIGKGKLLCMTEMSNSAYDSLKKYGVAFMKDAIDISDESQENFLTYVDSVKNKFKESFTGLTTLNGPKYIARGKPNRFVMSVHPEDEFFYNWNNIEKQIESMVGDLNLPRSHKKNEKK